MDDRKLLTIILTGYEHWDVICVITEVTFSMNLRD